MGILAAMQSLKRPWTLFWSAVIGAGFLLLLGLAWLSLRWPMEHDAPLLFYIAFLIDHHDRQPFREIFEINLPAVYYLHLLWGRWFGAYSDSAFRLLDLGHLVGILAGSMLWMWKFGRRVAFAGAILFGLWYLSRGTRMSLQREYILLLPVIWALVLTDRRNWMPSLPRALCVGLLFGFAASIKPASILGLPWLLWLSQKDAPRSQQLRAVLLTAIGVAIPLGISLIYMISNGTLQDFITLARNYWPLYGAISKQHELLLEGRSLYLLREFFGFGRQGWWILPTLVGSLIGWRATRSQPALRRQLQMILGFLLCYAVYVVLAGKFWIYHWLPFLYFALQLAALCTLRVDSRLVAAGGALALLLAAGIQLRPPDIVAAQLRDGEIVHLQGDRVDILSEYLRENVAPGQTVQPLDCSGGAITAMLHARVPLATSFVYDFQFYHHYHLPFIQGLRERFLRELEESRPEFILDVSTRRAWPSGPRTTTQFPELRQYMRDHYSGEYLCEGVTVYRRRPASP